MVIIAAVDDGEKAKRILQEADRLARAFNDDLQVVHVIAYDDTDLDIGVASRETTGRLDDIAVEQIHEIVGDTLSNYEAVGLVGEDVKAELNDHMDDVDVRYVVIGGRRRSPVGKALLGSITQSILLSAEHPVVTVM